MKKRVSLVLAAVFAVSAFIGVSQASAATEFGSACPGVGLESELNLFSTAHGPESPLAVAAPVSGVITEWKVNSKLEGAPAEEAAELARAFQQRLEVLKNNGNGTVTLVGESMSGPLTPVGASSFPARIPVQAGDLIGLGGTSVTLYCEPNSEADAVGYTFGGAPVGSTFKFRTEKGIQVPVVAKIEPDVDGDGYGDETQDLCPQSAAYQTACPVVTISSRPSAAKKSVTVYVATSLAAPVGVTGTINLGKGKKATVKATAKTVAPGQMLPFKLTLTKTVLNALAETSTKKSLTLSITASATNVTGAPSTSTSTVKLHGQAKPGQSGKKSSKSGK